MFTRMNDRFGTAAWVVAVVALIASLSSAAYAAKSPPLNGKQKKEVEKIAKKYAGKAGAPGANGAAGAPGAKGDKGEPGTNGTNGTNGKNVVVGAATGAECPTSNPPGGATVEVEGLPATKKKVCNGKEGEEGSPWTAGGVLPSGKTQTGTWAFGEVTEGSKPNEFPFGNVNIPISFSIPLAGEGLTSNECLTVAEEKINAECHVHFINTEGKEVVKIESVFFENVTVPSTACTGSAKAPTAAAGHLCVYVGEIKKAQGMNFFIQKVENENNGASSAGAILRLFEVDTGAKGRGSWAVTAP